MSKKSWWLVGAATVVLGCSAQPAANAEEPLQFPESVAGLGTMQAKMERFERDDDTVEQRAQAAEQLSEAYGGARTATQAYADDALMMLVTVYAAEAETPGLWSPQANDVVAEQLRLASPPEQIERSGDAECLVSPNSTVPDSTGPTRPDKRVLRCQGVRDGLTVLIPALPLSVDVDTALRVVEDSLDHFRPS